MPWQKRSVMEQRIEFVIRATQPGTNFSALCLEYGISRPTGYLWLGRYREQGSLLGLVEQSRRPHTSPTRTPAAHEERVLALRAQTGDGARKLAQRLARDEDLHLAPRTVHRILERHSAVAPDERTAQAHQRFERETPNALWQSDFKGPLGFDGVRCEPLSILDDHSRFLVGLYALTAHDTRAVRACFEDAFERYGLPEALLTDRGGPWWDSAGDLGLTALAVWFLNYDIRLLHGRVCHPQTQGKVERFHRTLKRAVRYRGMPAEGTQWPGLLAAIRTDYNERRPHDALDGQVPAQRYRPSARAYTPCPPAYEYEAGQRTARVNTGGTLYAVGTTWFISKALAGQWVALEEVEHLLLVRYRNMYVRELDRSTGTSRARLVPVERSSPEAQV